MQSLSDAIVKTLAYHAIFDYPLTLYELYYYLIEYRATPSDILAAIDPQRVVTKQNRYFLKSHHYTFEQSRQQHSWHLLNKTQSFNRKIFQNISTIHLLGVSGSTAALNAKPEGDIDLFVITKANTQWETRTKLLAALTLTNQRINTNKSNKENAGKFCVNLILEDTETEIAFTKKDLYTAMEFAHLKVIQNRNDCYQRVLEKNTWVQKYLPNFYAIAEQSWLSPQPYSHQRQQQLFNTILGKIHRLHFRKKLDRELNLKDTWTIDYRKATLIRYRELLKQEDIQD